MITLYHSYHNSQILHQYFGKKGKFKKRSTGKGAPREHVRDFSFNENEHLGYAAPSERVWAPLPSMFPYIDSIILKAAGKNAGAKLVFSIT